MDRARDRVLAIFAATYGAEKAKAHFHKWRVFFMACAELWNYRRGREWLVSLMESVEDIPAEALNAGIRWEWESFPEYLDALGSLPRAVDVGAQIPHGPLRTYVMDERGSDNEPATEADIAAMAALVEEAARAGALGFSTNRLPAHTAPDGRIYVDVRVDDQGALQRAAAVDGWRLGQLAISFERGGSLARDLAERPQFLGAAVVAPEEVDPRGVVGRIVRGAHAGTVHPRSGVRER